MSTIVTTDGLPSIPVVLERPGVADVTVAMPSVPRSGDVLWMDNDGWMAGPATYVVHTDYDGVRQVIVSVSLSLIPDTDTN